MLKTPMLLLAGVLTLVTLTVLLVTRAWLNRRRQRWDARLNGKPHSDDAILLSQELEPPPTSWAARLDQWFERLVAQTGLDIEPGQALGLMALLGVVLGGGLFAWREEWWLSALGVILGVGGVFGTLWLMRNRYRSQLQEQLPDALYLLARSLRAGSTPEQGITMLGDHGTKPLAGEFQRCAGQVHLGLSLFAALQLMAKRLRLLDLDIFVSTMALYRQTGGNLAALLDRLAAGARDRNQFRNHFLAATALARTTAIALGMAAPLLLLGYALWQPEIARDFFQSRAGFLTLVAVALLELIGVVWLYRLLRIEY